MTETLQYKAYSHIGYSQLRELGLNINGMSISIFVYSSILTKNYLTKSEKNPPQIKIILKIKSIFISVYLCDDGLKNDIQYHCL